MSKQDVLFVFLKCFFKKESTKKQLEDTIF